MDIGWITLIILAIIYVIGLIRSLRKMRTSNKFKKMGRRFVFSYMIGGMALIFLIILKITSINSK